MELYLNQNGEQVGPFTEEQLELMLAKGSISPKDLVWHEGLAEWQPVQSIIKRSARSAPETAMTSRSQPRSSASPQKKSFVIPQKVILIGSAVSSLVLGYFIGREHVKYQIRSAFTDVAKSFAEGFKTEKSNSSKTPTLGSITSIPEPEPIPQLMIGQTHSTDVFSITLDSAKISTTKVKDMMGDIGTGKNPDLTFAFTFKNNDDRRILRFRMGNQFLGGHFKLRDDVNNVIRGIDYGMMSKPVGALTGSEDIGPGSSVTHIELFSIPPPKTEHLILSVDLACLGGDGVIEFKIPASSIAK